MRSFREPFGEALGTFVLVLFGCGSVAVATLYGAYQGLMQIGLAWGIGVNLAIYLTRHMSCAHLNPAVSLAMTIAKRMPFRSLPAYIASQFLGAVLAAVVLYMLFAPSIAEYESARGIVRGTAASVETASLFGEFYPNPGFDATVSFPLAVFVEALGTFILVLMIFALTEGCNVGRPDDALAPLCIGLTVTANIVLLAPLTQAGLNPARDLGPRLVAWATGWGSAAFPDAFGGFFFVYVLGPLLGGGFAAWVFTRVLEPMLLTDGAGCQQQ